MTERYEINYGRFGAYFWDNYLGIEMDLYAVKRKLNSLQEKVDDMIK